MKTSELLTLTLLTALLSAGQLGAHEDEQPAPLGDQRLGDVHFPISCGAAAQQEFNRGVAILHSFYYPDALKSFVKVTELDSTCAIGYWGIAMSSWYPLWYAPGRDALLRGRTALERAQSAPSKTDREQEYLAAIGAFYQDFETVDHRSRALAYEAAMERLYRHYPEDSEAAAFYALALQAAADPNDKTYARQLKSGAILEKLYAAQPNHPGVAHYLIHAYDYPELAERALEAARRYGKIAPSMPHALHMPSHTFIALGYWEDSIQANLAANAAARQLGWVQEELHTMDYLVYAYLQVGRDADAAAVKQRIDRIKIAEKHTLGMDYAIAAAPVRIALEDRRWSDAAALVPTPSEFPATLALTHYARALGAGRSGSVARAQQDVDALAELRETLLRGKQDYWAKQVQIQLQTATAWLAWAGTERDTALDKMRAAVDLEESTYKNPVMPAYLLPARELLGDMLLDLGRPQEALVAYEASLRAAPNRFNGVYGAAQAAQQSGNTQKARAYYTQLLGLCGKCTFERPELRQARTYLALQ